MDFETCNEAEVVCLPVSKSAFLSNDPPGNVNESHEAASPLFWFQHFFMQIALLWLSEAWLQSDEGL